MALISFINLTQTSDRVEPVKTYCPHRLVSHCKRFPTVPIIIPVHTRLTILAHSYLPFVYPSINHTHTQQAPEHEYKQASITCLVYSHNGKGESPVAEIPVAVPEEAVWNCIPENTK